MNHVIVNSVSTLTFKSNGYSWHSFSTTLFLPLDQSFATHRPLKLNYSLATPNEDSLPYCHILSDCEPLTSSSKNCIMLHYTSSSLSHQKEVLVISHHPRKGASCMPVNQSIGHIFLHSSLLCFYAWSSNACKATWRNIPVASMALFYPVGNMAFWHCCLLMLTKLVMLRVPW